MPRSHSTQASGFTLIELVVAISLSAIVVAFAGVFIVTPIEAYTSQTRRAAMVDSADAVLRLMGRDVRRALPNSVRTTTSGSVRALELLLTAAATRYRDDDAGATGVDDLDFSAPDNRFTTLGEFQIPNRGAAWQRTDHYLAIYNVGIDGANAYEMANVITPRNTTIRIDRVSPGVDRVRLLNRSMQFAYSSPARRVYLVSGPVTYLCDTGTGIIRRYSDYSIAAAQPTSAADMAGATSGVVARGVADCNFDYFAGAAQRAGLVTLDVTVNDPARASAGRVRLLNQVHVENAP